MEKIYYVTNWNMGLRAFTQREVDTKYKTIPNAARKIRAESKAKAIKHYRSTMTGEVTCYWCDETEPANTAYWGSDNKLQPHAYCSEGCAKAHDAHVEGETC